MALSRFMKPLKTGLLSLTAIALLAVLAACGGGSQEAQSTDERKQSLAVGTVPSVAWAPASISLSANPGGRQDIPLTLTASAAMSNVTVTVPTALRSVVTVAPTALGNLTAGQTVPVTVTVAPGGTEALRTLTGSITVRAGFAAAAKALPVSVALVAPEAINGITVPPEPPKELNDLTLAGFDMNGNGVRDDVERLVARKSLSRIAFDRTLVVAKDYQKLVTTAVVAQADSDAAMLRIECFAYRAKADPTGVGTVEIKKATYNNSLRLSDLKQKLLYLDSTPIDPLHDCK